MDAAIANGLWHYPWDALARVTRCRGKRAWRAARHLFLSRGIAHVRAWELEAE